MGVGLGSGSRVRVMACIVRCVLHQPEVRRGWGGGEARAGQGRLKWRRRGGMGGMGGWVAGWQGWKGGRVRVGRRAAHLGCAACAVGTAPLATKGAVATLNVVDTWAHGVAWGCRLGTWGCRLGTQGCRLGTQGCRLGTQGCRLVAARLSVWSTPWAWRGAEGWWRGGKGW